MRQVILLVSAFFLICAIGSAQTAQINGTIRDAGGLAIPGASIKATQTATGVVRSTISGGDGAYVFSNLPIGPYLLEVSKDGFTKYAQSGIVLQVDANPTVDVAMKVGSVSEQVTVEADAAQVETRTTSIGQVVDTQRVLEMPLNGREVHELIFLAGMANYPGAASLNTVRNYPTVVVSVAGGAPDSVSYALDGVIHQDPYNNLSLPLPFPDALQEFKVETSAIPPQYGYHSTATVNAVTKSGTNEYHGDLFEFLRNGDLNANDFFNNQIGKPRDTLKRNQFGGTIGGPIRKDKLFFFGGYQRTSLRSDGTQATAFIPTQAMAVNGDFSAFPGKLRDITDPTGQNVFTNNQIPQSLLSPVAQAIVKTMPATTDPTGRTSYALVGNQDEDLVAAKIDWQASAKHSLYGRFNSAKLNQGSTYDGKNPLSIANYGFNDLDYGLALGETWIISPTKVNSLRVGASRTNIVKIPDHFQSWSQLGANVSPLAGNIIAIAASQFAIGGGAASPGESHNGPLWSIYDDVSWVHGAHQIGFGGSIYQQRLNYWSGVNAVGTANFDGSKTRAIGALNGYPLADFMLGLPTTFNQGTIYGFYSRQYYQALYIQDSWKITSRLTANFGVRWEPYTAVYQKYGGQDAHFDAGLFAQGVKSTVYQNAPPGMVFSGDSQYTCGNSFNCSKWDKFFPRVGLAWDPRGDGKMTIRAAFGMFGDRMSMLSLSQEQFGAPYGNLASAVGGTLTNPWSTYGGLPGFTQPGQNPMPILAQSQGLGYASPNIAFPTFGTYVTSPLRDFHPMYVNQWNLSIQRQFGQNWLVTANYLGTSTIHLASGEDVNQSILIPNTAGTPLGTCPPGVVVGCNSTSNQNQRRVLYQQNPALGKYYAGVGLLDDGGTAAYEGLYLSAQKRFSRGITVLANYTWSHCISDPWNQNPTGAGVTIPGARRQWRSNCIGTDLRQLFSLNMVATTPKFASRSLRLAASDWQIAPIMTIESAQEFSVLAGTDQALSTVPGQPANLNGSNLYPAHQSVDQWLNPSAFNFPAYGTYGNLGLNNMKGPGVFQLNLALSRNFRLAEHKTLQVRGEAFNLPNHLNPFTPGIGPINTTLFGGQTSLNNTSNWYKITQDISGNNGLTAGDYRVIQFAMKFMF